MFDKLIIDVYHNNLHANEIGGLSKNYVYIL